MKAGEIFITTTGEYSDYGIGGTWRALIEFSLDREIANRATSDGGPDDYRGSKLFDRLIREGKVEEFKIREVHLGDYGRWEDSPAKDAEDAK